MIAYVFVHTLYTSIYDIYLIYTIYKLGRTIAGATLSRSLIFVSARFIYRPFLVMTDVTKCHCDNP